MLSYDLHCLSFRCHNSTDIVGKSLADLQKQFNEILGHSQQEKEEAWARQRQLQEEMASQQEKLGDAQEKYRQACNKAAEERVRELQVRKWRKLKCQHKDQISLPT